MGVTCLDTHVNMDLYVCIYVSVCCWKNKLPPKTNISRKLNKLSEIYVTSLLTLSSFLAMKHTKLPVLSECAQHISTHRSFHMDE